MLAGESDAPQGVVNTSDGRVVRAFHRFTLVDQTGQGRDLTKGRRRDQVNEQVLPPPTPPPICLNMHTHSVWDIARPVLSHSVHVADSKAPKTCTLSPYGR